MQLPVSRRFESATRKYRGVDDPVLEKHIDYVIGKVDAYERDPKSYPKPTRDEYRIWGKYKGNVTRDYQTERRNQQQTNGDIASLIDQYAGNYGGR